MMPVQNAAPNRYPATVTYALIVANCLVFLIPHTPGRLVLAARQIARAVREHMAKVTVFVPHYAMSGGTLIALAANEIMKASVLGSIDAQVGQAPAASVIKVAEEKPIGRLSTTRHS